MNNTSSLQPNRKPLLRRFALTLSSSTLLLQKCGWTTPIFGLLVALFMLVTANVRATDGQPTAAGAQGTKAAPEAPPTEVRKMKLGIVIYSTDAETVWNAFRFGVFALKQGDSVQVFLLAKGVDCEKLNTKDFNVTGQMQSFVGTGGRILACGTCLKLRQSEGTELCPISTMKDLYDIVKESDRVLTF
ncbi:MAG: DsrE family protein [Limisphaerales bacterium]